LGDIPMVVAHHQVANEHRRFNAKVVEELYSNTDAYPILMDIASNGVIVDLPEQFASCGMPLTVRRLQQRMEVCFAKLCCDLWKKGKLVLLCESQLTEKQKSSLTVHSLHWTPKKHESCLPAVIGLSTTTTQKTVDLKTQEILRTDAKQLHDYMTESQKHVIDCSSNDTPSVMVNTDDATEILRSDAKKLFDSIDEGRILIDCTNNDFSLAVLNTDDAKEKVYQRYGKIEHTSMESIVLDWVCWAEKTETDLSTCKLVKADIASAFRQLNINPHSSVHMATWAAFPNGYPIAGSSERILAIPTAGNMGWTGMPMAWEHLPKAITALVSNQISGILKYYTDDFIMMCKQDSALADQIILNSTIQKTFNSPDALADDKVFGPASQGDSLGFDVNFSTLKIRPNDRAIKKLMLIFFSVDVQIAQPKQTWEIMASLAVRYSKVLRGMTLFVAPLHHQIALCNKTVSGYKHASSAVRFCVEMWRIAIMLLFYHREIMAVSFSTFIRGLKPMSPQFQFKSDASEFGIAASVWSADGETCLIYGCLELDMFHFTDQNIREYLGLPLSEILLAQVVESLVGIPVVWVGDNRSALSWARNNKCNSRGNQSSAIFAIWFEIYAQLELLTPVWQKSADMGVIDDLSRLKPTPSLDECRRFDFTTCPEIHQIMTLCQDNTTNLVDHCQAFMEMHAMLRSLLHIHY